MRGRIGTLVTGASLLLLSSAIGLIASAGTASAAADPIVIGNCATSTWGAPGQPVSLSPGAVARPVTDVLNSIPLLGPPLAAPFDKAFTALPPIPIGALPTGSGYISGGTIATQVVAQLDQIPLLEPVSSLLADGVQQTLTADCGIAVQGVNAIAAPIQTGTSGTTSGSSTGGITGSGATTGTPGGNGIGDTGRSPNRPAPGGVGNGGVRPDLFGGSGTYDYGRVPLFSYTSLPFAVPGDFAPSPGVLYGGNVPGSAPRAGTVDGVQAAGHARALPGGSSSGVAAPILIAVLALAGVTAALVRAWVLRGLSVA